MVRMRILGSSDADALLNEIQAASLLNLSSRTLQAWRLTGTGPAFVRAGRAIRYRRQDLVAWIDANICQPVPSRAKTTHANPGS